MKIRYTHFAELTQYIEVLMKCPDCGATQFYVKDPEDQFNLSEFTLSQGTVEYLDTNDQNIEFTEESEVFCDRCAWHDKFKLLK